MPVVSHRHVDLGAPPPVRFRHRRHLWERLRAAFLATVVVVIVAATFFALGYGFGEAVLGG
jgi:hypothetical protein